MPETNNVVPVSTTPPVPTAQPQFQPAKNNTAVILVIVLVVLMVLLTVFLLFTDPGKGILRGIGLMSATTSSVSSSSSSSV